MLAAIVRLLDTEYLRVGNEQYARDNKSFGLSTLRTRHLKRKGNKLAMRYGARNVMAPAFALITVGLVLFTQTPVDATYTTDILPAMLLLASFTQGKPHRAALVGL